MPEGFRFPFEEDVWVTHRIDPESTPRRGGSFVEVAGHLKEGVTLEAANAELAAIAARIEQQYPDANEGISAYAVLYEESMMPDEITVTLYAMLAAVFGVLLIACANVANLLLARAAVRQREVAVRTALGANRWHVIRQLMAESLLLALAGGALGALFAYVGTTVFANSLVDIEKPYWIHIRTDAPALLFTMGISLIAAVLAGTMPALRASGANFGSLLRDESRGSSSLRLGRFSASLVVFELALSCALLVAAGFMTLSIINVNSVELGFEPSRTLTARVGLFEQDYPDQPSRQQFFQRLMDAFREEPAIEAVALASHLPSGGRAGLMRWAIGIEGESYSTDADYPTVNASYVTDGFFESFGVEVLRGSHFRPSEVWPGAEQVAIVNESFVARYFPDRDPLGRRFRPGRGDSEAAWIRIIGVVPDMRVAAGVGGIGDDELTPESVYVNMADNDPRFLSIALRTQGPPRQMSRRAREVVASLDPNLPIYWVYTMQEVIDDSTWAFGIFGTTFAIFGFSALFLAAVGLYGVVSFSVARRRPEMGLRMALGAETADIYRLVFRRVLIQLAIGLLVGVGLGFALSQPLRAVMYAVDTTGMRVYLVIVLTLLASGLLATFFPAYRATRVDPLTALRPE
jgi:predicted permease